MKRKFLAMLLSLCMALSLLPVSAFAEEGDTTEPSETSTAVAKIGDTEYATLDEAVAKAEDKDIIELLADATTEGLNLSKDLTIQAAAADGVEKPTITFTKYGIALWGKALTFKDVNVVMNDIGSTPYTAEWNWMTICASKNASLSLDNATMTLDGANAGNKHAIYFCSNNKLNLTNGSNLTIKNYQQDALEWDGGDGGYNVNITDSTFVSDHNRSGFTGTFYATITRSNVQVINSTGNGSNGSHFIITDSKVDFNNNTSHGLSTGILTIDNSTVTANRNGANGIHTNSTLTIRNNSTVTVENNDCSISSKWTIPGAIYVGAGESVIENSTVTIQNNKGSGIYQKSTSGSLTIEDTANVTIIKNTAEKLGLGGGIYVNGTVNLANNVVLYNNHAGTAGDDIYNLGTITFGKVGTNWSLDGDPDCTDAINGWYDDSEGARWEAHATPIHVKVVDAGTYSSSADNALALKAAHDLIPAAPSENDPKPEINKTATDLTKDKTDVTLSIGANSTKENVAVMFVLDKSTSTNVRNAAAEMLDELATKTNTNILYDVVVFSGVAGNTGWKNISDTDTLESIKQNFVNPEGAPGTNMSAGLQKAAEDLAKLDSKYETYLITLSDGISYFWTENGTTMSAPIFEQADGGINVNYDAGTTTSWDILYDIGIGISGTRGGEPADAMKTFMSGIEAKIQNLNNDFKNGTMPYDTAKTYNKSDFDTLDCLKVNVNNEAEWEKLKENYPCSTEIAIYYAAKEYTELVAQVDHCYAFAVPELTEDNQDKMKNWQDFPWGKQLMLYLAEMSENANWKNNVMYNGDPGSIFDKIRNEIFYEIQSATITDVIGADFTLTDKGAIDKETFTLTANGTNYTASEVEGNIVYFGEKQDNDAYPFVLTYYQGNATKNDDDTYTITSGNVSYQYTSADTASVVNGGASDEFFVLQMNIPVVSLELKYNLSLTSKQTAAGNYTVPTNESATLVYYPTDGVPGILDFPEPTVSYTVKKPNPPTHPTNPTTPPALNTEDHFAYIIGYPVDYYTGEPTDDQTKKPVKPEGNITRAEVATIFFRLLTDETRNEFWSQTSSYGDVSIDAWYNNAICTLSNAGILKGYEDGSFRPNGNITRAEFATIAVRFFETEYNGADLFPDIDKHWARDYINQAASAGLVAGYPDGTFGPDKLITRAEAVTIVNRTIDRHPDVEHLLDDMLVWPDNMDTTKWYYADMQEATNSHEYTMNTKKDETKFEIWQKILPVRDWEAFEKAWADANAAANPGEVVR